MKLKREMSMMIQHVSPKNRFMENPSISPDACAAKDGFKASYHADLNGRTHFKMGDAGYISSEGNNEIKTQGGIKIQKSISNNNQGVSPDTIGNAPFGASKAGQTNTYVSNKAFDTENSNNKANQIPTVFFIIITLNSRLKSIMKMSNRWRYVNEA